jgi:hypothetical protein
VTWAEERAFDLLHPQRALSPDEPEPVEAL